MGPFILRLSCWLIFFLKEKLLFRAGSLCLPCHGRLIPNLHELPDADGKTNWRTLCREADAGVVAAGRRLRLHLQDGEEAPKPEAGGAEAVTLTVGCSFLRRATPCPAAALPAATLPTSPTPARTGDRHQELCSLGVYRDWHSSPKAEPFR